MDGMTDQPFPLPGANKQFGAPPKEKDNVQDEENK